MATKRIYTHPAKILRKSRGIVTCELIIDEEKEVFQTHDFYKFTSSVFKKLKEGDTCMIKIECTDNKVSLEVTEDLNNPIWKRMDERQTVRWKELEEKWKLNPPKLFKGFES